MTYLKDENKRVKIDALLKKNAQLECTLGKDSTKQEFTTVKYKQNKLFTKIKELDVEFYNVICP